MGWFLDKNAVIGLRDNDAYAIDCAENEVPVFYYNAGHDENVIYWDGPSYIEITRLQFYPTQKPIRVNYFGANSRDDEIFYLLNEPEAKAEYERQLLLEATKENSVNKTTSKRKI